MDSLDAEGKPRTCTTCDVPVIVHIAYVGGEPVDLLDVMHAEPGNRDHEAWTDLDDVFGESA